jgi:hypothetical protein
MVATGEYSCYVALGRLDQPLLGLQPIVGRHSLNPKLLSVRAPSSSLYLPRVRNYRPPLEHMENEQAQETAGVQIVHSTVPDMVHDS